MKRVIAKMLARLFDQGGRGLCKTLPPHATQSTCFLRNTFTLYSVYFTLYHRISGMCQRTIMNYHAVTHGNTRVEAPSLSQGNTRMQAPSLSHGNTRVEAPLSRGNMCMHAHSQSHRNMCMQAPSLSRGNTRLQAPSLTGADKKRSPFQSRKWAS